MGWYSWRPYVPVAERRRKAARELEKLGRKGMTVQPVCIEGRAIARTFWGKAWCDHLESFSDYENRLPRGRTYVRNGSVCHLEVLRGGVKARVSGSELYTVAIDIKPLASAVWKRIKERCTGRIASILDLLQGSLSSGVMAVVTDRDEGLFPKPREISMECSCPDWAVMCKHVAAVLYGVGARLDEKPELLFLLRGVNHEELIAAKAEAAVEAVLKGGKRRRIAEDELGEVFGVDIEPPSAPGRIFTARRGKDKHASRAVSNPPAEVTGNDVKAFRERLGLSRGDFARLLGVSPAAVSLWERTPSVLRFRGRTRKALEDAWKTNPMSARKKTVSSKRRSS
jgi:uncharacterized Zn finger protein